MNCTKSHIWKVSECPYCKVQELIARVHDMSVLNQELHTEYMELLGEKQTLQQEYDKLKKQIHCNN